MTTNDTAAAENAFEPADAENSYQAPAAELAETNQDQPILKMTRFSTWAVFFLSVFTVFIYFYYWMYSRSKQINALTQDNKVNMPLIIAYIVLGAVGGLGPYVAMAIGFPPELSVMFMGASILNIVVYIFSIFSMRRALSEVINAGNKVPVKLGGVKTFFFSGFFFQYKINQAIDIAKG